MRTLVELLHSVSTPGQRPRCLAVLYFNQHYLGTPAMTTTEVRDALIRARVPRAKDIDVGKVFRSAGALVDSDGKSDRGLKLWRLTGTGINYVRDEIGLPQQEPEVTTDTFVLTAASGRIADPLGRAFVEEAIACLRVGALRAAVVFAWTGAVRVLHDRASQLGWAAVEAAVKKHDPRVKSVVKIEDFALVSDRTFLLAARDLALVDKGQWTVLQQALDLRNQCGHPSAYSPGPKRVGALIEDLIGIVFI